MSQDETTQEDTVTVDTLDAETAESFDSTTELPDDHPLVKTLAKQRAELKDLKRTYTQAAKELDEYRKSQLTEHERIIEQTKEETRQTVRFEFAEKLVEAELKSSLKGRSLIGESIFDFDKKAFVDSSGDIDTEAIAAWVEAHSVQSEAPKPDLGQGARGAKSSLARIMSREELQSMSPGEILAARKDGRLDSLMGK
jgi:hypothetical protein